MIRCYYNKKTLCWAKWNWLYGLVFFSILVYSWTVPIVVWMIVQSPFHPFTVAFVAVTGFAIRETVRIQWNHRCVDKTTIRNAGDEITLDDETIRLIKADGTQITLPRKGLKIQTPQGFTGSRIFIIWNSQFVSCHEVVLTNVMENARELVEAIDPSLWDRVMNPT